MRIAEFGNLQKIWFAEPSAVGCRQAGVIAVVHWIIESGEQVCGRLSNVAITGFQYPCAAFVISHHIMIKGSLVEKLPSYGSLKIQKRKATKRKVTRKLARTKVAGAIFGDIGAFVTLAAEAKAKRRL